MRARPGRSLRPPLIALALLAGASPAVAEPLAAALARAYRGNPQLGAERARQRADDENVPRALAGYRPTIAAEARFGPNYERYRPGQGDSMISPLSLSLTLQQTLFDSGKTTASVRSAESAVLGGRATLRGVEQTVLLNAVTAYMDVLRDEQLIALQIGNLEGLTETLRIARKRYESGDTRRTDSAQAEARLARGHADLAASRAALEASRATYRQVIGASPQDLAFPASGEGPVPRSLAAAIAFARDSHPAVRAAIHAVDAAEHDVKAAEADLGPQASAQGVLGKSLGPYSVVDPTPNSSISGQVTVPIYDGGGTAAAVRLAKETVGQRRMELSSTRADVVSDLRSAWGQLEAARAAIPAMQAAIAASEVALAGVRREELDGQRTILDVLNAQQELLNARSSLVTARRDLVVASYGVLSTLGGLTAKRLALRVPVYRPETHYDQVRDLTTGRHTPDGR